MPLERSQDGAFLHASASGKAEIVFVILAFGITWTATIPEALQRFGLVDFRVPQWVYGVCLFGPAIAAIIVAATLEGTEGLRRLARTFRFRFPLRWYGFALFVPLATLGVASVGMTSFAGLPLPSRHAWWMTFSQTFWLLPLFLREELGWRGYLLPRLLRSQTPLRATAGTTLVWAVWHLPQYATLASVSYALLLLVLILPISVLLTLFFVRTRSIIPCVLFHSAIDVGSAQLLFFTLGRDYLPALVAWIAVLYLFAVPAMRALSRLQKEEPTPLPAGARN